MQREIGVPQNLFRAEALAHQHERLSEPVAWVPPRQRCLAAGLVLMFVLGAAVVLALPYTEKLTVPGRALGDTPPVLVAARSGGVLSELLVARGDVVDAGAPLARLEQARHGADGRTEQARQIAGLRTELRNLRTQLDAHARLSERRQAQWALQARGLRERRGELSWQQRLARSQLQIAAADRRSYARLLQAGQVSRAAVDQSRLHWLGALARLAEVQLRLRETHQRAAEVEAERIAFQPQARLARLQLENRMAQLLAMVQRLQHQHAELIVAPLAGQVAEVAASVGTAVNPGAALLTLAPPGPVTRVELMLPSRAVGQVRQGMPVRVRFEGFPPPEFDVARGRLVEVGQVAVEHAYGAVYRSTAALEAMPTRLHLVPAGMPVEVDIVLQSRVLGAWLIRPLSARLARL